MMRALKVVLIVFGVIEIILGLLLVISPEQVASMASVSDLSGYLKYTMVSFGIGLIVPGVFLIIAAGDPVRHINWVKFVIAWCALGAIGGLYAVLKGSVEFNQVGMQIIMDAVFALLFLGLYPYRVTK